MTKISNLYGLTNYVTANSSGNVVIAAPTSGTALYVTGSAQVTGQLTLGSTITNGTYTYTLPSATGTLALTSSLGSYVPYTGATGAVNLGAYDLTVNGIKVGKGGGAIGDNTAVGASVLNSNTTGSSNTAIGYAALLSNTIAGGNTAIGAYSLLNNISGGGNTAIGYNAGESITTGSNNVIIGGYAGTSAMTNNVVLSDGGGNIRFQYDGTNTLLGQSGNIGIGVSPSAWGTPFVITEYPYGSYVGGTTTGGTVLGNNNYYNGTSYIYKNSDYASQYNQSGGNHIFRVTTTGTAGNVITWTPAMTILSGGNVLINTTTDAGYKLDVNGTGRFSGNLGIGTALYGWSTLKGIDLGSNAALGSYDGYYTMLTNNTYYNGSDFKYKINGYAGWLQLRSDDGTINLATTNSSGTAGASVTGMTTRLSFSSTGAATFSSSVTANSTSGISGTFTSSTFFGSIDLENTGGTATGKWNVQAVSGAQIGGSAGSSFGIYSYGASAYRMFINSSGNVGIGTTSPSAKLDIQGSSIYLNISDTVNSRYINLGNWVAGRSTLEVGSGDFFIKTQNSNDLFFGTNSSERMRITSGGRVGIGISSPGAALQVAQPGVDDQLILGSTANNRDHAMFMCSGPNQAEIIRYQSGVRLILAASTSISNVDVIPGGTNGVRLSAGNTSWSAYTSDARRKKNFESVPGLDAIMQVEPVKYHFNTQNDTEVKKLGFTAQNLLPLIPEMVHPNGEKEDDGSDTLTIIPDYILPVLVQAIKDQQAQIEELKQLINN